jgi:cell division transport system permease protein
LIIAVFGLLLLFISTALINNTVRLAIYSKRFLIRTMQLIGATPSFIRKPFLFNGVLQGFTSGLLAFAGTFGVLKTIINKNNELEILYDQQIILTIAFSLVSAGIVITWFSTYLAVRKYLRIKTDKLF